MAVDAVIDLTGYTVALARHGLHHATMADFWNCLHRPNNGQATRGSSASGCRHHLVPADDGITAPPLI